MKTGHLALFSSLLLLLLTPTLLGRKTSKYGKRNGNHFHKVLKETQHRAVKKVVKAPDSEVIQEALDKVLVTLTIEKKWRTLTSATGVMDIDTSVPRVKFEKSGRLTLKEAFHYMRFYPVLYVGENRPTIFEIPIGDEFETFKLTIKADKTILMTQVTAADGKETNLDDTRLNEAVATLSDSKLKDTLESVMVQAADNRLNDQPNFKGTSTEVTTGERDEAFRAAVDVMAFSFVLGKDLSSSNLAPWLQRVKAHFDDDITEVSTDLQNEINESEKTKLNLEVTASFLVSKTSAIDEWNQLKADNVITETQVRSGRDEHLEVVVSATGQLTLRKLFKLLQFYSDIYEDQKYRPVRFEVPIGGEQAHFRLGTSIPRIGGKHQIFVTTSNADWPGTTQRGEADISGPTYDTLIDGVFSVFPDQRKLATTILESVDNTLDKQPRFSDELNDPANPRSKADTIRASVEFMVIAMIAEAAQPGDEFKTEFIRHLATKIREQQRFPKTEDFPKLTDLSGKSGRSPAMDELVRNGLEDVTLGKNFQDAFSSTEFPIREKGGTNKGRAFLHKKGSEDVRKYATRKRAATEHDEEMLRKRIELVAKDCTGKNRRRKRTYCSLNDRDAVTVDEESITFTDNNVEFDVVDRRNAKERTHMKVSLENVDLAMPKLIKEHITKSRMAGATEAYVKINRGLAVHGIIFSVLGAADYFSKGDNVRGSITLSQSVHTLGGLTGINEVVTKVGKHVLREAAKSLAKGLGLERGLERFSTKVETFMEKGVGRLLGDIPGVGLAFDIYFIELDIEQLADLDLSDPEDVKLLPLRIIDLALDVGTTVLSLIGNFLPEAEVVTEPLVIVLSIIRMSIDDFYIDIMAEMEKVNWKSPWVGLEFLGALVKGILEGAADFLTGGLRRQMENYRKQQEYDKKLLKNLENPDNYYRIVGEKEGTGETIDFTSGMLSSFGGYINFRLLDNNRALLEIGDVSGSNHKTIRKTFKVDSDIKDIVLGLGESREFTYKHETAKLWFIIPIKSYDVICGEQTHENSVYGTYYGNSKNNTFYAVQKPKPTTKSSGTDGDEECDFGNLNLKFVTGNYYYNLYGRGGSDTFYLGPEMSTVTGGGGSDVYIIHSEGGKTIIDNFSEDTKRDIVLINVNYNSIQCHQTNHDLDVTYTRSHHIRIKKWFTPGDVTYYRHVSFRSKDGVIFSPQQVSLNENGFTVQCVAVALDLTLTETKQTISLTDSKFSQVKQVSGSNYTDNIAGNDLNNVLDGGRGADYLSGGKDEDTYIIRANEGCDVINNNADDYLNTTDIVVFDALFEQINVETNGNNLSVSDRDNPKSSCFTITNWTVGYRYRHILFTSSDHVVFNVSTSEMGSSSKVPIMLDYKTSSSGVCVDLSDSPRPNCVRPTGFANVATVSDSAHNDHIVGNAQSNFFSCSGGEDYLEGGEASDNYVVKKSCTEAKINNTDSREKVDLLFIEEQHKNLRSQKSQTDLKIISSQGSPTVYIRKWFQSGENQHLAIRTIDGITLRISNETGQLEPTEVSKDPTECQCTNSSCDKGVITYNLEEVPWTNLVRFQLKSSHCSYRIYGNNLNNYLDPGAGNGYNYQYLEGKNGSDTYVIQHGYGEFNEINNYAEDNKLDILQLGLEFDDINIFFYGYNGVILASKTRPSSLSVRIMDYFRGQAYQHLQIVTADKTTFEVTRQYPYRRVITVDRTSIDSPQDIEPNTTNLITAAQDLKGSLISPNKLTGSETTIEIEGGAEADILRGGESGTIFEGKGGNDTIYGSVGNDIIFGGDGDDVITAGAGDDYIYGGNGADIIDGGDGSDTITFKGDGFLLEGVRVDLNIGFGKGVDAEGDRYQNIENVYGTIHNDTLTGSDYHDKLYGVDGNDTLIAFGGDDQLTGGEGKDSYILYKATGLKVIDNYAEDEIEDTLSLIHLNSTDICVFLVGNDLYLQVDKSNLASALLNGQNLTVTVINWKVSEKYRHLKVAFKDTLWEGFALSSITSIFENLGNSSNYVINQTELQVNSTNGTYIRLSWQVTQDIVVHPNTEIFLVNFDKNNPKDVNKTQVGTRTSLSISSLNPNSHYVFTLALEQCSAIIAVSHTLITFGRERACSEAEVLHSSVMYRPNLSGSSPGHGTKATVVCDYGYNLENQDTETYTTCLDGNWVPSLPVCRKIKLCPSPRRPTNGEVSTTGHDEGSKAHYVCHKGYRLSGPRERTCVNEAWDILPPWCQPLRCPRRPRVGNGAYHICRHMYHTKTYGTFNNPIEGYCFKLSCNRYYLPTHEFNGSSYRPRWESDWKIPQGGIVCSDGKWIGFVSDTCDITVKLTNVQDYWNKKQGLLTLWENGEWRITSSEPEYTKLILTCPRIRNAVHRTPTYILTRRSQIKVTCPMLRLVSPKPTPFEGKLQVYNRGIWKGVCVIPTGTSDASSDICDTLGFHYESSVISISTGWTDLTLTCSQCTHSDFSPVVERNRQGNCLPCRLQRERGWCGTMVRCRQRCTKTFPVPNGGTTCPLLNYEGSYCSVWCNNGDKPRGSIAIYCSDGHWLDYTTRRIATAYCTLPSSGP